MAHVGSADTFFAGKAGPYDVRVSVRLPGVIPGRAQVAVRVAGATAANPPAVTVQAGQWNVGLKGAPPPEPAVAVAGDPTLFAAELWFMTATSYQLAVVVDGAGGRGSVTVPVMALATAQRPMPPWLGGVLAALGLFLTAGMLTIIGAAVRESVLPPGEAPDAVRRRRGRIAIAATALVAALALWGGNRWWSAEASAYGQFVLYRPFDASAATNGRTLTLSIDDPRWTGTPTPLSRYNALLPDHGKLMHMFLVRDGDPGGFAHLHPVPRTPQALQFDTVVPPLPPGAYRVSADIGHESGNSQSLDSRVDVAAGGADHSDRADPDDSSFAGSATAESPAAVFPLSDGAQVVWDRGADAFGAGSERDLKFSVRDAAGAPLSVEPYMGMAAHVVVASRDGSVFAHLHPSGSISMAAMQKFSDGGSGAAMSDHSGHMMADSLDSAVAIPFAFPKAGAYRVWVQFKRAGTIETAAFDTVIR
jgi:hypothetical protein